jgi:hypothetical protein
MKHFLVLAIVALSFQINAQPKCVKGDCINGVGKLVTEEYTYEGTFKNGKRLKGILLIKASGEIQDGTFSDGKLISGKRALSDGSSLEGKFVDGKLEGADCVQIYSDGTTIKGQFIAGEIVSGRVEDKLGNIRDGEFKDGKLISGKLSFSDGSRLEGKFVEGKIEGKGKQINSDGDIIEGEFHEGVIVNGIWKYTNHKNKNYYEGSFALVDGLIVYNGKGTLYFRNNSKLGPNWKNGDPIGNGEAKAEIPEGKLGIELKKQGGVYLIKGNITRDGYNHTYDFVFDTGASLVSVPFSVLKLLHQQNIVTDADFNEKISLQTASGDVVSGMTFNIKELEFKTTDDKWIKLYNVEAVVKTDQLILESLGLAAEPPILLGQSAISKLKRFELDYEQNLLLINN